MPMAMMMVVRVMVVVVMESPTGTAIVTDHWRGLHIDDWRRANHGRRRHWGERPRRRALRRHHDPVADAALLQRDEPVGAEIETSAAAANRADDDVIADAGPRHFDEVVISDGHGGDLCIGLRGNGGSCGGRALIRLVN